MTNKNKNGAALLPPDYLHEQNESVKMILIRDYAGYCFAEDTRQTLIFNGIPCKTLADLQAIQTDLPALLAKGIISDADADLCARAVKEYRKSEPNGERIYNTFRNMEMAVTRLREMLRLHSEHLPDEADERSARGLIVAITNAAGLAVRQLKQKPGITIQTLKSLTDIYSLLIITCYHAELWHGGRPDGPIGEFVKTGPDPGGFPSFAQLYEWAAEYKLISIPPESFAVDFDEYAAAVSDALNDLTGYKEELKTAGEEWPQPPDAVESYADELIKIPKVKSHTAQHYIAANDTVSNHLNSQTTENLKINGGPVDLPDRFQRNKATKTVIISASLESAVELSRPITEFDRAVSNAVYSHIEAGNTHFTAAMIYRTMTGKTDREYVTAAQSKSIEESLSKLALIRVTADFSDAATARELGGRDEDGNVIPVTLQIGRYLLPINSEAVEINGEHAVAYTLIDTPPLYAWAKKTGQITTLPNDIMDVKKVRGGKVGYQSERTTETRTAIKSYLLRRLEMIREHTEIAEDIRRKKRGKTAGKSKGPYNGSIRYETVVKAAGIDWGSLSRPTQAKYRTFIKTCLANWRQSETATLGGFEFEEYKDKNKIVGVRVTYPIK